MEIRNCDFNFNFLKNQGNILFLRTNHFIFIDLIYFLESEIFLIENTTWKNNRIVKSEYYLFTNNLNVLRKFAPYKWIKQFNY